jgi:predicted DNA-binding WGR domain protein
MTEGKQMTTKWCLLKDSDGDRGILGKKKIYEVVVEGDQVTTVWGMAEKPNRQRQTKYYSSAQGARYAAMEKIQAKVDKGYVLTYAV